MPNETTTRALLLALALCACGAPDEALPRPALRFVDLPARLSDSADDNDPAAPGVQRDVRVQVEDDDGSGFDEAVVGVDDDEPLTHARLSDSAATARVTFPSIDVGDSDNGGDGQHWLWARVENADSRTLAAMAAVEVTHATAELIVTAPELRPPATDR